MKLVSAVPGKERLGEEKKQTHKEAGGFRL